MADQLQKDPRFSKTDKPDFKRYCIHCDGFWIVPMCPCHDHPQYSEETRDGWEMLHLKPVYEGTSKSTIKQ